MKTGEKIAHTAADTVRAVAGKEKYRSTAAIILAAGNSSRMQGENKQFIKIDGKAVLERTLEAFERSECISEIVVVTKKEYIRDIIDMSEALGVKKLIAVVPGGENRQESAFCGLLEISDKTEFVAIHDGARCLITPEMIEKVCRQAYVYGAATAATMAVDTVKKTEKAKGFAVETLDRNNVWLAQTPQVFGANLYRAAAYTARKEKFLGTDDCSIVEKIGYTSIRLVECGRENIKITNPDDIPFAEAILAIRKRSKK